MPAGRLTEGITLFTTGLAAGLAPGAALVGLVVDASGASASYWVTVGGRAARRRPGRAHARPPARRGRRHRPPDRLRERGAGGAHQQPLGHRQVGQQQLAPRPHRHQPDRGSRQAAVRARGRAAAAAGSAAGTGRSAGRPACPAARAGSRAAAGGARPRTARRVGHARAPRRPGRRRRRTRPGPRRRAGPRRSAGGRQEAVDLRDVHPAQQVRVRRRSRRARPGRCRRPSRGPTGSRRPSSRRPRRSRRWSPPGSTTCAASRPHGSPSKPEWSMTPAIASGCSDCSSRARMPPTNIDASPCTWRIGASSSNQRGPTAPWMRSRRRGPSGPATRANSLSPRLRAEVAERGGDGIRGHLSSMPT